jgi:hypothetical protein
MFEKSSFFLLLLLPFQQGISGNCHNFSRCFFLQFNVITLKNNIFSPLAKSHFIYLVSERRPLKGFMKMYKTPPQRRRKKATEDVAAAELEAAAEVDAELSMAQAHEQRMLGCSGASINHLANNVSASRANCPSQHVFLL